jgi:deoxycytidylate deaminase
MYLNTVWPCKGCAGAIINAGIVEVVVLENTAYDELARVLFEDAHIKVRSLE